MDLIGQVVIEAAASSLVKEAISAGASACRKENKSISGNIDQRQQELKHLSDSIESTLHGIARKDLLASISFFNEGFVYLCQVFGEGTEGIIRVNALRAEVTPGSWIFFSFTAWQEAVARIESLKPDLEDSARRALSDAIERFKDARRKATKAFCNEALSTGERILAMRYRVAATLFEKVENPAEALGACRLCLEELHAMPAVEDSFARNQSPNIHKDVCDMNSVICDVTQLVGHGGELLNWPCVVGRNGKNDPLHNERSRKLTGHCCVTRSFGQEGEEKQKLKFAWSITSNTRGDFIVGDGADRNVKVFDDKGTFLYLLDPFADESKSEFENEIWNVASARDDVYVLTLKRNDEVPDFSKVYVFNERAFLSHKFALREGFRGLSFAVDDNNQVFITGGSFSDRHSDVVEVYRTNGTFVRSFGNEHLTNVQDITITDEDRVMVLDGAGEECPFVQVFSAQGQFLKKFKVESSSSDSGTAITFHKQSETVLVASLKSESSVVVSMYSKDGIFVRAIQFKTKGGPFITGVTATAKGRIAVPGQNVVLFG